MYFLNADFDKYALPEQLTARYKNADGAALKVALFLLQNQSASIDDIVSQLSLSHEVAARAVSFWVSAGLAAEGEKPAKKAKLTTSDLARISLVNPELPPLMREAQSYLGRQISYAESVCIAELYVNERIPSDLLLFMIAYTAERASSTRFSGYLSRLAAEWKKADIDTLEKAERYVEALQLADKRCGAVAAALGLNAADLKLRDRRYIGVWFEDYGYDETFAAEASLQSGKTDIPYLNAMIKGWHAKGYATIKQTRAESFNAPVKSGGKNKYGNLFENALKKYGGDADG